MGTRCFIAIECNNAEIITRFREVHSMLSCTSGNMKHVEPENTHLTLKFLGEIDQYQVDQASEIVREIMFQPFNFTVEGVGVFPNMRRPATIWAGITEGVAELAGIFNEVDKKLSKLGFKKERRGFHPHLTISRVRSGKNRDQIVEKLIQLGDYMFGIIRVERISLKKSVLTPSGPIYTTIIESREPLDI
ncbi:RNA 2',3'-cyclic phosphodiesterase [Thermoproteota archaeon]